MLDTRRARVVAQIPVGSAPGPIVADGESVWAALENRTVVGVDPRTRRVIAAIPTRQLPYQLAYGDDAVWVLTGEPPGASRLARIDPAINDVLLTPRVDAGVSRFGGRRSRPALAVGAAGVWVSDPYPPGAVKRGEQTNGKVASLVSVSGGSVSGPAIAFADGSRRRSAAARRRRSAPGC